MVTEIVGTLGNPEAGTSKAASLLRAGQLVAFPTETVYGLGANGLDGEAVLRIFEAKGRPQDNPLILHVSKKSETRRLWLRTPALAQTLMDTFWPGPLTLVAPKSALVPDAVTAGLDTVAVRMPADRTARLMIQKAGVPVAAPSANRSGRPSPTTAAHVLADMDGRIPLILDGGPCKYGVESTVLLLGNPPIILRPGAITREMLESVVGEVKVARSVLAPLAAGERAASPGMKYRHYAPEAEVRVVSGAPFPAARAILALYDEAEASGRRCVIAGTEQTKAFYLGKQYVILGNRAKPDTLCASLFAKLRDMELEADLILAEGIPAEDEGLAYMNRLLRAAGFSLLEV